MGIMVRNSSDAPVSEAKIRSTGYIMMNGHRDGSNPCEHKQNPEIKLLSPGEYICLEISKTDDSKLLRRDWEYLE
ncbi:hypothetical protein CRD60_00845 [Bifidobacterium aemilianum]|uniref:Uncharacterized protein n=1 Tax=Bifidobacterium aemilianum TaxID=2493120 RepID=A0A366KAR5_9BIFI|nr:hypothetical protein CRD60_00845 [Bifidobacterium aemilianum]